MLGETGRWVIGPIRGSGDFLAYGSPSISAMGGGLNSSPHMGGGGISVPSLGGAAQTAAHASCDL